MPWLGQAPGHGFHAHTLFLHGRDPADEQEARQAFRLQLGVGRLPVGAAVWRSP
jgi:hypothetical protein